jgi:DNA-binding response OmpR family regulator
MVRKGKTRILAADDEPAYRRLIKQSLEMSDYQVDVATDAADARRMIDQDTYDLLLLDVRMPDEDGLALCRHIRRNSAIPIIMLTALSEEEHIVGGLKAGADDYMVKPFGVPELTARVEAALRRSRMAMEPPAQPLSTGALVIDLSGGSVICGGKLVSLTATEYRLLTYMARNIGRVLTHNQLLDHAWGPGYADEPQLVHVTISRLRNKVEINASRPRHILTRPGIGYLLAALPPD